MVERYFRWE